MSNHLAAKEPVMNRSESSASRQCPPPLLPCPWFVFSYGKHTNAQIFFSIPEDHYYKRKIPDMCHKEIWACFHGWMVITDDTCNDVFLLNPVSMEKIELPPLKLMSYRFCTLSSPPNNPNCIVVFFREESPHMTFCHPGDSEWVEQDVTAEYEVFAYGAIICEGKIYGLTHSGYFLTLEAADRRTLVVRELEVMEPTPQQTSPHLLPEIYCRDHPYLVESCGEIFLVSILRAGELTNNNVRDIEVHKMDFSKLAWVRVESLGDRAFFVNTGGNCMSCPAAESGINGNSIYFIEADEKSIYVFDMEEKTLFATLPSPNVVYNWCDPMWIMGIGRT